LKLAEPKLDIGFVEKVRKWLFWLSQTHVLSQSSVANG
jgi:hypothetical protein